MQLSVTGNLLILYLFLLRLMNDVETLHHLLSEPASIPSIEWVKEMHEKYPYFSAPLLLLLERGKETISDDEYLNLLGKLSVVVSDRQSLSLKLGEDMARFISFYPAPEKPVTTDTTSTIDKFLDKFGGAGHEKEISAIENAIFNPVPDYGLTLSADEDYAESSSKKTEQDNLIDSFLAKCPAIKEESKDLEPTVSEEKISVTEVPSEEPSQTLTPRDENVTLSESLASVYIKQKKYAKAYDILLSVKQQSGTHNPHLDDQLRFLQKIINLTTHTS